MTRLADINALLLHIGQRIDADDSAIAVRGSGIASGVHVAMPLDAGRELRLARNGSLSVWTGMAPNWMRGPAVRLSIRQRIAVALWVRRVWRAQMRVDQMAILDAISGHITNASK